MSEMYRDRRYAELRELQQANPRELINLYCRMTGEIPASQLPQGVSFSRMIESIVALEQLELVRREATA